MHGYRRRASDRPRFPLVELVFHELDSVWAVELVKGVENVAKAHRATVVLTRSGTRHAPAPDWIEGVLRRRPLGVVLVFSSLPAEVKHRLRSRDIPFVIVDPAGDPDPDVPSVGSANWAGGLAATRHLTDLGHERVAIITGPEDMLCSRARLDGYRSAMTMAGLPVDPRLVRFGDFRVAGGFEHAMDLLDGPDRPTAVFAGSDLHALGVLEAARLEGLRVPADLSVVGYDDVPLAQWSSPPLTTVHQPLRQMAEEATRMLFRRTAPAGPPGASNWRPIWSCGRAPHRGPDRPVPRARSRGRRQGRGSAQARDEDLPVGGGGRLPQQVQRYGVVRHRPTVGIGGRSGRRPLVRRAVGPRGDRVGTPGAQLQPVDHLERAAGHPLLGRHEHDVPAVRAQPPGVRGELRLRPQDMAQGPVPEVLDEDVTGVVGAPGPQGPALEAERDVPAVRAHHRVGDRVLGRIVRALGVDACPPVGPPVEHVGVGVGVGRRGVGPR